MKLAIKGHNTRYREVKQLLQQLGGQCSGYSCAKNEYYYYINKYGNIEGVTSLSADNWIIFTLEEFEELYPFKVGDKVHYTGTAISFNKDNICTITGLHWNHALNKIFYILDNQYQCSHKWIAPMKQKELKDYLKPGYIVEYDDGDRYAITQDVHDNMFGIQLGKANQWSPLKSFHRIVTVYQINKPTNLHWVDVKSSVVTKVWERKEVELTMQEIADKFGISVDQLKIKK